MKHRFQMLDIFRGIFASMVVLFHLSAFSDTPMLNNKFVYNSDVFVDFFFVLSGFVIAYNYKFISTINEFKNFLYKRILRIYPLHLLMLLVFIIIELSKSYLSTHVHVNKITNENNNIYSFFTNLFLVNSIKLFGINDVSWNIVSWSISAELISYIVFGIILLTVVNYNLHRNKILIFAIIVFIAYLLIIFITNSYKLNYSFDYGFLRGIIGFFVGSISCFIFNKIYEKIDGINIIIFNFMEICILVIIILTICNGMFFKKIGFVYDSIFFLCIFIFAFERGIISTVLKKSTLLVNIGKYSYSIYMTHTLLISLFNIIFIRILKLQPSSYTYLVFLNYYIIYKISKITYIYIESKFKNKLLEHPTINLNY